jgi:hypothetical protein
VKGHEVINVTRAREEKRQRGGQGVRPGQWASPSRRPLGGERYIYPASFILPVLFNSKKQKKRKSTSGKKKGQKILPPNAQCFMFYFFLRNKKEKLFRL